MASAHRTRKERKERKRAARIPEDVRIALVLLPAGQAQAGNFEAVDISNHSDWDQRTMVRSGERRTIRRLTHIQRMASSRTITAEHAAICEWYAKQHELGYQTVGCTANYSGAGGGGFGPSDLLARYRVQAQARANYIAAREALPSSLRTLFERIVIHGHGLIAVNGSKPTSYRYSRLSRSFRLACDRLREIFDAHANDG